MSEGLAPPLFGVSRLRVVWCFGTAEAWTRGTREGSFLLGGVALSRGFSQREEEGSGRGKKKKKKKVEAAGDLQSLEESR